jgi:hypothetical protein|tara:strand:+ start:668 stop:1156 length:489 start_codon:yes stop_codon:yes gene_type:complete
MNNIISRINDLPKEISDMIMFMARPRLSISIQKEIYLEAALMLCEQHYNWWYPKMCRYWHINDIETTYEFPDIHKYGKSIGIYFNKEELVFITTQLLKCGCCKRHSQGIFTTPHCHNIRLRQSHRATRQMNNDYGINTCTCHCRHFLRVTAHNNLIKLSLVE